VIRPGTTFEDCQHTTVQARWHAAYTKSRHEKSVAAQLDILGISNFLPLYTRLSRWKDRRVRLRLPLFPNYVFVQLERARRVEVFRVPGVISLVSSKNEPVALPESEIERLQQSLTKDGMLVEPHDYLQIGQRVRVVRGPFQGFEGILEQKKNSSKLIISIPQIMRAFAFTVQAEEVEPIAQCTQG